MTTASPAAVDPRRPWQESMVVAAAVVVGVAAFTWIRYRNPDFFLNDDAVRDQLFARDCLELGHCHLIGARTSFGGFSQGAVWLDLLIAVRRLGGGLAAERTVVFALLALGVATMFLVVWRWLRPQWALPAVVLFTEALARDGYTGLLVNSSASSFPDVLTAAGLLCFALSNQFRFLLLAAFAVGVGINVHIGSVTLVPPLMVLAALGPRPWRHLALATGVIASVCLVTSRAALLGNLIVLDEHGWLGPAAAAGAAIVLAAVACRPRCRRVSSATRVGVVGAMMVLPFLAASVWLVAVEHHHFSFLYFHPVLAPAAVMIAAVATLPFEYAAAHLHRVTRWIPTAAVVALCAAAAVHLMPRSSAAAQMRTLGVDGVGWSLTDAKAIADRAQRMGWSYEELLFHLQSNDCRELLIAASLDMSPPRPPGRDAAHVQLQVLTMDAAEAPAAGADERVQLDGRRVAVVREIDSWLRPRSLQACRQPLDAAAEATCAPAKSAPNELRDSDRFLFVSRPYPEIHALDTPPPYVASYAIPVVARGGEARDFMLADHAPAGCEAWRIAAADGMQVDGTLPAARVRLRALDGRPGTLRVEKAFGTTACASDTFDMRYPPCIVEMRPDDPLHAAVFE